MKAICILLMVLLGSVYSAQTPENPLRIAGNSTYFPSNEWYTKDGKILCYRGGEMHIREYGWILIHEADGNYWIKDEDSVREADEYVELGEEYEYDAHIWNLSSGKKLIMIFYPVPDSAAIFLCPGNFKDITSLVH